MVGEAGVLEGAGPLEAGLGVGEGHTNGAGGGAYPGGIARPLGLD